MMGFFRWMFADDAPEVDYQVLYRAAMMRADSMQNQREFAIRLAVDLSREMFRFTGDHKCYEGVAQKLLEMTDNPEIADLYRDLIKQKEGNCRG